MVMERRQMFNSSQNFGIDGDRGWNHTGQPYIPIARGTSGSSSSRSIIHSVDNMNIQGGNLPPQWNPAPRSSGYSSPILNCQLPYYQSVAHGPSCDTYLHHSAAGNLHMLHDNYLPHSSYSNIDEQPITGVDGGSYDQTFGNSRGQLKRKSPGAPSMWDRGSTSRYYDDGSSWQEQQNAERYHAYREYPPSYRVNSLSIGGEGMVRNVRSRTGVCPDTNLVRTLSPSSSLHHSYSRCSFIGSNSLDFWGHGTTAPREWNSNFIPPAAPGVTLGSDSRYFNHDQSSLNPPNSCLNSSLGVWGYNNDVTSNTHHVRQNVRTHLNQSVRGTRGSYHQRSHPTFRASSSNFNPRHATSLNERQQMAARSYPSRHQHGFPNLRLHNVDRNGGNFISGGRYRSNNEEGPMDVNHFAFYGSRSPLDQHSDLRLDIDDMSYEELLALGERIGSVSIGLSDDLISKSLTESIYSPSDVFQDKGICVICLEEYKNTDKVGMLKMCGHDFHVGCIRKWLSTKNSCPICKASAMDDNIKEK